MSDDHNDGFRKVKITAAGPYGRGTRVFVDGVEQIDLHSFNLSINADGLHMVTLTFPAHVTLETTR